MIMAASPFILNFQTGMHSIVEDFESTIQELMNGKEEIRKEKDIEIEVLRKEKETAVEETASVEKAFSDLHKRSLQ